MLTNEYKPRAYIRRFTVYYYCCGILHYNTIIPAEFSTIYYYCCGSFHFIISFHPIDCCRIFHPILCTVLPISADFPTFTSLCCYFETGLLTRYLQKKTEQLIARMTSQWLRYCFEFPGSTLLYIQYIRLLCWYSVIRPRLLLTKMLHIGDFGYKIKCFPIPNTQYTMDI